MGQILNPFDQINPLSDYYKFKKMIILIKDKNELLRISELIQMRLNEIGLF
jgi:hypothetical protein